MFPDRFLFHYSSTCHFHLFVSTSWMFKCLESHLTPTLSIPGTFISIFWPLLEGHSCLRREHRASQLFSNRSSYMECLCVLWVVVVTYTVNPVLWTNHMNAVTLHSTLPCSSQVYGLSDVIRTVANTLTFNIVLDILDISRKLILFISIYKIVYTKTN